MSIPNRTVPGALSALVVLCVVTGCSQAPITAPLPSGIAPPGVVAPPPPSRLAAPSGLIGTLLPQDTTVTQPLWQLIQSVPVLPGLETLVTGGRYSLRFAKGSLDQLQIITITDYDPNVLDVQFGPHGTRFVTPVELTIDFSGTAADPRTPYTDQSDPVLWYLNETTNRWEEVPGGVTDWVRMKYVVHLEHFSRYVLGGKAGWKQSPRTEDDN